MRRVVLSLFAVSLLLSVSADRAAADPCGMVPPIYVGPGTPIARTGDQNTYVFYKDGVETFVIHPGFKGKVEEFGMLIPFPKVPEGLRQHLPAPAGGDRSPGSRGVRRAAV